MTGLPGATCRGCGASPAPETLPFRCPNADRPGAGDDVDHVLEYRLPPHPAPDDDDPNPFVRFRSRTVMHAHALATGMKDAAYVALVRELDDAVAEVDGRGFRTTPYARSAELSAALGLDERGGLWIKDETGGVAGSHKARHLFGIAVALAVAGRRRRGRGRDERRLAIASCGNAALAAAVVARALRRELSVFVPTWADRDVIGRLVELGARVERCERAPGDPPGDPCTRRFRAAVREGALPFTVQGNENALTLEGGVTLGSEVLEQHARSGAGPLVRCAVQVGGGALASSLALACERLGAPGSLGRLHPVQPTGGHPFARAWRTFAAALLAPLGRPVSDDPLELAEALRDRPRELSRALPRAARERSRFMWPWEVEPKSIATGILDDETYDWWSVLAATIESGGWPVIVDDATIDAAWRDARERTHVPVSTTGVAGLAGMRALSDAGVLAPHENVLVLFTGVR